MTGKEAKYVQACVEQEGFDYAFTSYSSFTGEAGGENKASLVKDKEFHRLREAFLAARKALAEYIGCEES